MSAGCGGAYRFFVGVFVGVCGPKKIVYQVLFVLRNSYQLDEKGRGSRRYTTSKANWMAPADMLHDRPGNTAGAAVESLCGVFGKPPRGRPFTARFKGFTLPG